jgi:hypothetical protein
MINFPKMVLFLELQICSSSDRFILALADEFDSELLFFPDTLKHYDMDTEAWSEEMEKFDNNFDEYKEIDGLESHDSFEIMADFVETLPDSKRLKNKLIEALNRKRPFREFKFVIDNSGEYRQKWFEFKDRRLQEWVTDRFNEIIELE